MRKPDFCEKHNYALKQCSNHADIDVMCRKSRHLHAASRCASLLFGYEGKKNSFEPRVGDDVKALIQYFVRCNVFGNIDKKCDLDRSLFAMNDAPASFAMSDERQKINNKHNKQLTVMEKRALMSLKASQELMAVETDDAWADEDNVIEAAIDDEVIDEDELDDVASLQSTATTGEKSVVDEDNVAIDGRKCLLNKKGLKNLFGTDGDAFSEGSEEKTGEREGGGSVPWNHYKKC